MKGTNKRQASKSSAAAAAECEKIAYEESQPLNLGAALKACDEHDIVRKGTSRKGRYLMVLPLHMSVEQGGTMGTFTNMDTAHPKLVIPTEDGNLELEGSFVNTTTSYLVCNCQPRKEHSTCEHVFNQLLVFGNLTLKPSSTTNATSTATSQPPQATLQQEGDGDVAETKEKEVTPAAPFYGVSDRPPFKLIRRRSSAASTAPSQSGKKRKRAVTAGMSSDDEEDGENEASRADNSDSYDEDNGDDDDDDDDDVYVEKGSKAAQPSGARRQSLRATKVINYSALEGTDSDEDEEDSDDGEQDDDHVAVDHANADDDRRDVDEVVHLDISSEHSEA